MTESVWKIEFRKAMINALVEQGCAVCGDRADAFSWRDTSWQAKRAMVASVGIDYTATKYQESYWYEFMGTFYEGDSRVYGVDLDLVLLDGTRLHWRYDRTLAELITAVLGD